METGERIQRIPAKISFILINLWYIKLHTPCIRRPAPHGTGNTSVSHNGIKNGSWIWI